MNLNLLKWIVCLATTLCAVSFALAQAPSKAMMEKAPAKPMVFDSVLGKYQPYKEQDIQSWTRANEITAQRGGWRQYLKESQSARSLP
jgi:hypothetical protein